MHSYVLLFNVRPTLMFVRFRREMRSERERKKMSRDEIRGVENATRIHIIEFSSHSVWCYVNADLKIEHQTSDLEIGTVEGFSETEFAMPPSITSAS